MAAPDYEYVALRPIAMHGITAFQTGDLVPAEHVETHALEVGVDVAERGSEAADEAQNGPTRPKNSATKAEWVDYVVALADREAPGGLTREDAENRTRDDLVAHVDAVAG